jgi:L-lactate dehydrogenase complex protein LldG
MVAATVTARADILARIRDAIGPRARDRAEDYAAVPRRYRQTSALNDADRLDLFSDRLAHYDAGVYRCAPTAIRSTVAQALAAREKRRIVVPADLPPAWIPDTIDAVRDANLSYADLDHMDGVLTGCTLAIALTGTIVLSHAAGEGRRALSLIPDYHLCVIRATQIVETVPEAFRRIAALHPPLLTTISGPSATADIEMTRVRGVHGPRTMDVVIVGD